MAHGQKQKSKMVGKKKAVCVKQDKASEHVDRNEIQQIKPARERNISTLLLLLTTTPAVHWKWMKQSGGKAFFYSLLLMCFFLCVDFVFDVFFVIRLGGTK